MIFGSLELVSRHILSIKFKKSSLFESFNIVLSTYVVKVYNDQ